MFGRGRDVVEIKESRWDYFGTDSFIRHEYRYPDGSYVYSTGKLHWYNRWFVKLMNRNKPKDTRTIQEYMRDAGIVRATLVGSNVTYINMEYMKEKGLGK